MERKRSNFFSGLPDASAEERFETLVRTEHLQLERIVSTGQATPKGEWLDQDRDEWVMLLSGAAGLLFEGERDTLVLRPGDHLLIPSRQRHRVEWTDAGSPTLWLALHFAGEALFQQIS